MPTVGLGTWNLAGRVEEPVLAALTAGYRHIDTAKVYDTEEGIGRAITKSSTPREDIFITTKLANHNQGYESALAAIDESLEKLGMTYVDLYLIHWPFTEETEGENRREETWRAMEEIHAKGKAKAIGVSNFEIEHLKEMDGYAKIKPAVNQIELHPFWYRKELVGYCRAKNIAVTAYSPLTRREYFGHETLKSIAEAHGKSVAQVLLRWNLQHGNVVIPKSASPEHIAENIDVFGFELSGDDMWKLDSLNENRSVV